MKRMGNLYPEIKDPDNLRQAFLKAVRGKRNRPDVRAFAGDFESQIRNLHDQLDQMTLDVGHYRFFHVWDPKQRMICAASFPERVLHHALMNICGPALERISVFDSYACRKGKGLHKAILRTKAFARKYPWYLKLDIRKYFDSIDHGILMKLLEKRFKDKNVLEIFSQIFNTYHTRPGKGLPIGNLVSQYMANFYLSGFDHWIKETLRIPGYIRYMDDFVLFGHDKIYLKKALKEVELYLYRNLQLVLKDDIQLNRSCFGISFLGFRVSSSKIRLASRSKKRFVRKFKIYEQQWFKGNWTMQELARRMEPLVDFTRLADSHGFRRNLIKQFGVTL